MSDLLEFISDSPISTKNFGKNLAKDLKKGSIVCFFGELGAGKTTLIKAIASEITNLNENEITSPTFNYLNIYSGEIDIFHFDLYRIKNEKEFVSKGFDEYFSKNGICLIEWAEKISSIIPRHAKMIHLLHKKNKRNIIILKK